MTRLIAALLALAWFPGFAAAGTMTWELSGTVDWSSPDDAPYPFFPPPQEVADLQAALAAAGIAHGTPWSARISFDSDAAGGSNGDPTVLTFPAAQTRFDFSAGSFTAATESTDTGDASGVYFGSTDGDVLTFSAPLATTAGGLIADSATLALLSFVPGVLPYGVLPADPPEAASLAPFTTSTPRGPAGTHFSVRGHILVPAADTGDIFGTGDVPASFVIAGALQSIALVPEPPVVSGAACLLAFFVLRRFVNPRERLAATR